MSAEDTAYTTNMGLAIAGNVTDMHWSSMQNPTFILTNRRCRHCVIC